MKIAIAQINTTVGDIEDNGHKILEYANRARRMGAAIVVFPELAICGYPPEDLLLKPSFIEENLKAIRVAAKKIFGVVAIIGFADRQKKGLYNAAALIENGRIKGVYHKTYLPNYGVFDEKRYFKEGGAPFVFKLGSVVCGITICEDVWYAQGPVRLEAKKGAKIIFVINASPYHAGKGKLRQEIMAKQARANKVSIIYANLVGGQDELVFDGQSFVVNNKGAVIARAGAFKEDLAIVDMGARATTAARPINPLDEIYQALVLGLGDYVHKNGFKKVVIGLSGGIDSAVTAAIAREALGRENVIGVSMPSMFTARESKDETVKLSRNLGIKLYEIPIGNIFGAYLRDLKKVFTGHPRDITEENIQARIRGNILMAISNKFGYLVLTTGNKSEVSCGYCTLYGDMAGGFSVIKDVPKMLVYKLAKRVINKNGEIIPRRIIARPPTAELRPNQKDTDTLPPYEILDPIIEAYVEKDRSLQEIARSGKNKTLALKVIRMIDRNEYKRRQASPGVKITPKAFGRDRRMPLTNRFVEK
jgi:NAD+ synthase (glutamine-hydrolysing)